MRIVKYPHCTPIIPSRGTKLWKNAATVRAIGVPNIVQKRCQPPPREVGGAKLKRQGAAKTALFEARAARRHARQHAGPVGRNLTEHLSVLRATLL